MMLTWTNLAPYCNGTKVSKKLPIGDSSCRDHGHRSSVWFWYSSTEEADRYEKQKPKDYCFVTYPADKCGGGCPIRGLDLKEFLRDTYYDSVMTWEKQASEAGWHHLYDGVKEEYGRCVHKLKAKRVDESKDVWERSYRVVQVSVLPSLPTQHRPHNQMAALSSARRGQGGDRSW